MTADIITAKGYGPGGILCDACHQRIRDGEDVYVLIQELKPWLPEDHEEQDWQCIEWHARCDQGSLAADGAKRIS